MQRDKQDENASGRPTEAKLERLYAHFYANERSTIPMTQIAKFAIATTMRIGGITPAMKLKLAA